MNDENSSLPSTAGQFKLQLQPPKQASALKSARKAFGNITNNGQQAARSNKDDAASAKPQRRVFGDITNSAAKPPAGPTTVKKQPAGTSSLFAAVPTARKSAAAAAAADAAPAAQGTSSSTSQTTSAPVTDQQASSSSKAEWWEGLEPERPVGKTAAQLDAELDAAMEADALRSADDIWQNVIGKGLTSCIVSVCVCARTMAEWQHSRDRLYYHAAANCRKRGKLSSTQQPFPPCTHMAHS